MDEAIFVAALKSNLKLDPTASKKLVQWNQSSDCCCWGGVSCQEKAHNDFKSAPRIGNLTNSSVLNFSNAGFEGQIPKGLSRLTRNDWCQALSSSLPNLLVLSLSNYHVSVPIHYSLLKLHSLSVIRLDGNRLSAPVPGFFANFTNLTSLGLTECKLNGTFPKKIFQVPTLRTLDISLNKLLDGSFPEFPLEGASKSSNWLHQFVTQFTSIYHLKQLFRLDLSYCGFNGTLPTSITRLTQLVYLDLSLTSQGMINGEDEDQSKLKHLQFQFLQVIPSLHYQNTTTVTLKGSEIELVKILTLFTSIDLFMQQVQGTNTRRIGTAPTSPETVLSGKIPNEPAKLTFLSFLNLSYNQLVGKIPSGNQIQTFIADSFAGNKGLCGPPLMQMCNIPNKLPDAKTNVVSEEDEFDWLSTGFIVGFGDVVAFLLFWVKGRSWLDNMTNKIRLVALPMLGFV
ncbi:receptor-like protein 35 [Ziziphus jujuba]|uniref:Receptor-like protein 35 n=1 Tax=Ziziphus jujuba TaxID=326968 RepID=A0ABM3I305_ZIZJJ|nr:receptor-like protein 35 [Ziziphus jujuba]